MHEYKMNAKTKLKIKKNLIKMTIIIIDIIKQLWGVSMVCQYEGWYGVSVWGQYGIQYGMSVWGVSMVCQYGIQ